MTKHIAVVFNKNHVPITVGFSADSAWSLLSRHGQWSARKMREYYKPLGYYCKRIKVPV